MPLSDRRRHLLKTLLPAVILLVAAAAAWAMIATRRQPQPQPVATNVPDVETVRVQPQTLPLNVISQGVVLPKEEIDLVAEISGKVIKVHPALAAGGFFAADELLLSIDPRDYDYAITVAQARLAEAKRALASERAQVEQAHSEWQALGQGQASDLALRKPQLAEAEAKLKAAEADLAKARLDRSRCELRAPFAGRVVNKSAGLGQFIQAGSVTARVFATDTLEVRLPIGVDQLAYLKLPLEGGQNSSAVWPKVSLRADIGGKTHSWFGRLVRTEAKLDSGSGQLYLIAQIDKAGQTSADRQPLLAGLFVHAEIEGIARSGLYTLPHTALNSFQQVKLVNGEHRLKMQQVKILRAEPQHVVIESGLNPDEQVIVSELPVPIEGMQVNPVAATPLKTP